MVEAFAAWWMSTVGSIIPAQLSVFLVSMIPLIEERGGLIIAAALTKAGQMTMWEGILWCVIGNILPIPFILMFLKKIFHWMSDHHMSKIVNKMEEKAQKNKPKIDKYGFWGLMIFVGIPLPGTGAWSGSLVASVFDMDVKKASISILLGVFLAAVIMVIVSYGVLIRF